MSRARLIPFTPCQEAPVGQERPRMFIQGDRP
jgi:hypothetical protein